MQEDLWRLVIGQGAGFALFIWLFFDTRKKSEAREEKLCQEAADRAEEIRLERERHDAQLKGEFKRVRDSAEMRENALMTELAEQRKNYMQEKNELVVFIQTFTFALRENTSAINLVKEQLQEVMHAEVNRAATTSR